jgi:hypothetical protein
MLALAAVLGAAAIIAVVLASDSGHKATSTTAGTTHSTSKKASQGRSTSTTSTSSSSASSGAQAGQSTGSAQGQSATSTAGSATAPVPSSSAASGAGNPVSAVQTFYQLAAAHQFQSAWKLADPSFRTQLDGFSAFSAQQSHVRSIHFDSTRLTSQTGSSATVALQTTPVLDSGTEHCQGTVDLAPGGGGWLLHHISIGCTS